MLSFISSKDSSEDLTYVLWEFHDSNVGELVYQVTTKAFDAQKLFWMFAWHKSACRTERGGKKERKTGIHTAEELDNNAAFHLSSSTKLYKKQRFKVF